ncbi:MAG: L-2-amino-thiazoline-4-carboxylic acid hydrolase [Eubacteriales bacterium]
MQEYTVEQHAALIGLVGKYLEQYAGEYGIDLYINVIVKYATQRGKRMQNRAIRDGRPLNYETFLAYSELKLNTLPTDYSVKQESPVYINCCHRCMWDEGWKVHGLSKYGEWYCKYVDLHLVQGFSNDMVMITKTMLGLGDDCCTFVNVGYEQTKDSVNRIAKCREELAGRYVKGFDYHLAHFLSAFRIITLTALKEQCAVIEESIKLEFTELYGEEVAMAVWEKSTQDFDQF